MKNLCHASVNKIVLTLCGSIIFIILYLNVYLKFNIYTTTKSHTEIINLHKKIILLWTPFFQSPNWNKDLGTESFSHCQYNSCYLTNNKQYFVESNAVLIHFRNLNSINDLPKHHVNSSQIWIFYLQESPYHSCPYNFMDVCDISIYNGVFNWTATYLPESDIPVPYGGYYQISEQSVNVTSSLHKTKFAITLISNCLDHNKRLNYVKQLRAFIQLLSPENDKTLDIYGKCSDVHGEVCMLPNGQAIKECETKLLGEYKFYLAFENSNCRSYITEKTFKALEIGLIPIVMGANYEDYVKVVPPNSFIYVASTYSEKISKDKPNNLSHPYFHTGNLKSLAQYLLKIDANESLYRSFHAWKRHFSLGSLSYESADYLCQICRHLHVNDISPKSYNLSHWWNKERDCSN